MCSVDNSDLLQGLWYKFLNSSYKNKSEILLIFLRSLYEKSIRERNRVKHLFITSDVSGIAVMLTKQFLSDLESIYIQKDNSDLSNSNFKNLTNYLESEKGSLLLYGIEFIIEQIVIAQQNDIDVIKSSVLKIILESELGNILATTLLSIMTEMCLSPTQIIHKSVPDSITVPELTFTQYLRRELNRTNPSKKIKKHSPLSTKMIDYSTDDNDLTALVNTKSRRPKPGYLSKPNKNPKISQLFSNQKNDGNFKVYEFQQLSQTEIGELCQSDFDEPVSNTINGHTDEASKSVHVLTSLRIAARLLHHIIPLDPSMHTDAITIYLEVLKSCCRLLNNPDFTETSVQQQLLKLMDELLCNIALTTKILVSDKLENNSYMTILLGHKVIDRLLQICQPFLENQKELSLMCDLNKLIFYMFIIISKQILVKYSGSCRPIIHLFTCWYNNNGRVITQMALNYETDNEEFYTQLRNTKMSLFSEICTLLSIIIEIPDEKRKTSISQRNSAMSVHHSDQFNYIHTLHKVDPSGDVCCYASLCHLLLNNLVYLLESDSNSKSLHTKKKQLYCHILSSIKSINFCCTIDLLGYSNKLVTLLVNPMIVDIKVIVIKFMQQIIEISFEFYKNRSTCDCQYTSRHDVVRILQEIRNVCVPKSKESTCPLPYYNTTFVDLLHFIDWLAKIENDMMKHLIIENVSRPIFKRLLSYSSLDSNPHHEMIGSSILSLMPYLNSPWKINDLELVSSVCHNYPNLRKNYYKCLTTILLSTRCQTVEEFSEKSMKTRIIEYLITNVNFESLIQRLDTVPLEESVNVLLEDVYIWQSFRILFTYNDEFRRCVFENNGIDCCYVMLKQIIKFISTLTSPNLDHMNQSIFLLFESLMCLVIDGNMLKNTYYYEGYSYEIIWSQLQSTILNFFPKEEIVAQQLIQSLLDCCFRHKWTVQNELYQLRKLFLDSIIAINTSVNSTNIDSDFSDFEVESTSSDNFSGLIAENVRYDADASSDTVKEEDVRFQVTRQHDLRETESERANIFIDLNTSDADGNGMEINTDFLRLFIKIVLSLPIDAYNVIIQKALESVYNSLKLVPEKLQRPFICDDFLEIMMDSVENILTSHNIPGLQSVLLKLVMLPYSCWCSTTRLRFLIVLSQKNPTLREEILKLFIEKTDLIQSFQPELSLILPVVQETTLGHMSFHSSMIDSINEERDDDEYLLNYLFETKLTKSHWKGLDFDWDSKNQGFSVSMWIQLDGGGKYKKKKEKHSPKKNKKKHYKSNTPTKTQQNNEFGMRGNTQGFVHLLSLYSKDKTTNFKFQCFQIWCKPSSGTVMVRLYQRLHKPLAISESISSQTNNNSRSNTNIKSQLISFFPISTSTRLDFKEPPILIDSSIRGGFTLVGASVINNLLPLCSWAFLTITINWQKRDFGSVTWMLNDDVVQQTKLSRSVSYVSNNPQNLESFVRIGQVNSTHEHPMNQNCNLGNVYIFEGAKIQTSTDNLSLMFMAPNWDGGSVTLNNAQREKSKILGTVIMGMLVDKQTSVESGAQLLERSQNILEHNWIEKMNDLITNHLVGSFTCGDISRFKINPNYSGESELASTICSESQETSSISLKTGIEDTVSSTSQCYRKYILKKNSIDSAFENLGGISILMFWLAKLVEDGDQNNVRWLLKLTMLLFRKSIFLNYQNVQEKGYSIIYQLFKSFKMSLNYDIINDMVQHMIYDNTNKSPLTSQTASKLCRDPHILQELLLQWKTWSTSKLTACNFEMTITESNALLLDKYLLGQINSLLNEDNIYSIINCGSLGVVGILSPLLIACREPFEALDRPLSPDICQILIQIINNLIPTPVHLNMVKRLCDTILQLYPVSMKDNDVDSGLYYRHLKSFVYVKSGSQCIEKENPVCYTDAPITLSQMIIKEEVTMSNMHSSPIKCIDVSLLDSKVSSVEKKAMKQFYDATLSYSMKTSDGDNETTEIEKSTGSTASDSSSGPTIINENESDLVDASFETVFITSNELAEKPSIQSDSQSSRVKIISGLISILENVIEVKISDSVLEKFSMENFCFEFVLHMLTHSSPLVRRKSLSLFRVYLYHKKSLIQQSNNKPFMLNLVSHVIHQNSATKEIIAETISIIFGQNLSRLIMDIDWEYHQIFDPKKDCDSYEDINSIDPICKLFGIISNHPEDKNTYFTLDDLVNATGNHLGLYYRRSSVLLLSALGNVETESVHWTISICAWLFANNSLLLHACIKSGLLECFCNIVMQMTQESITEDDVTFGTLMDLCVTIVINLTLSSAHTMFFKLLEMCEIMHVAGLKLTKKLLKSDDCNSRKSMHQCVIKKIVSSIINTIFLINESDPAFQIPISDNYLLKRINKFKFSSNHSATSKMLNEKLLGTINTAINMIINIPKCFLGYYFEVFGEFGINLLEDALRLISKCLACNEIPEQYSVFLSCKESIKSHVGDLMIFLTHSSLHINLRIQAVKCLLKFPNFNRVIRYCLLGNSSGSICMIINIKQILDYVCELPVDSEEFSENIKTLFEVVSLDFNANDLDEDSRKLWIKDCEHKSVIWKEKFRKKLSNWNDAADRNFKEISMTMKNSYNNYRTHARKNLQQEYISNIRDQRSAEFYRRRTWKTLNSDFTQEKAIWNDMYNKFQIYRLDPTEGPSRIRRRMVKTTHKLQSKFFNKENKDDAEISSDNNLNFLFESTYAVDKMVFENPIECQLLKCIEDVRFTCPCVWVSQSGHFNGEFFVGSINMGFLVDNVHYSTSVYDELPNPLKDFGFISWSLNEIEWVLKRRFKLRDYALEIFMKDGRNCLIAMNSTPDRDHILSCIESVMPMITNRKPRLADLQTKWLNGEMSNFDYLTVLNTAAGRSYNDIMQYPVFPFILTDYSSVVLDLWNESTFRDLSKPISVQKASLRERVAISFAEKAEEYQRQMRLMQMSDDPDDMSIWAVPPHHYSSLYSNSATVLYYMVRVPPFTQKFIEFQDDEFDRPDRMFHTLGSCWELSTSSLSCMKEIIPEFFYLPEMFVNSQGFNFGERHNGTKVNEVILPRWCSGDARLFCLIHRVALESPFVSNRINHWIDLIFGYKQTGKAALEAMNLFHPYTYYKAICPDEITEEIRRRAVEQMIENYGQIPKQLFSNKAHSNRKLNLPSQKFTGLRRSKSVVGIEKGHLDNDHGNNGSDMEDNLLQTTQKDRKSLSVINGVIGIPWGDWVGSPDNHQTFINDLHKRKEKTVGKLFLLPITKATIKRSLKLLVIPVMSSVLVLPQANDGGQTILRFSVTTNRRRVQVDSIFLNNTYGIDFQLESLGQVVVALGSGQAMITSIAIYQRSGRVFFGMDSGLIEVYEGDMFKHPQVKPFMDNFTNHWKRLLGHNSAVTHLVMGESFAVLASCDSQSNVAIWNPQKLNLIHFIDWHSVKSIPQSKFSSSSKSRGSKSDDQIGNDILSIQHDSISEISAMCFSETLGDLVVSRLIKPKMANMQCMSHVSLFTINGKHVESIMLSGTVVCLTYTNLQEGRNVNAIAAVTSDGRLTVMSSWNLQVIWKVKIPQLYHPDPVISIQYIHSARELYVIHESGHVQVLQSNKPDLTSRQFLYFWL